MYLYPNNETAGDVDEHTLHPGEPPSYYLIYFNQISDFHGLHLDLDLLWAMIEYVLFSSFPLYY